MNRVFICGLILLTFSFSAFSGPLSPSSVKYASVIKGIRAELTRTVALDAQSNWIIRNEVKALFLTFVEQSVLQEENSIVKPLNYQYRSEQIDFQWDKNNASVVDDNEQFNIEIHEGVQDKISYQLQLQLDLITENGNLTDKQYAILDGSHIKYYDVKKTGEEILHTPAGDFEAVKIEISRKGKSRKTIAWMAKNKNYLLVRLQRIKEGNIQFSMDLENLQ